MIARSIAGDTPVIPALVTVIVGIFFIRGASRLRAVVKTEGDDVAHLMGALQSIGTAFLIQLVMAILGFVMVALVAGLGISGAF